MLGPQIVGGLLMAGEKPEVPIFRPVNTTTEQANAVKGNRANFQNISDLASQYNTFNMDQLKSNLEKLFPGYGAMSEKVGKNISAQLSGELPKDVTQNVQRNATERALGGGYGGSGMARNLEARDLGLTSYQMTQQGLDSATRWMAQVAATSQPSMFNMDSMFITPQQRIQTVMWNREQTWNRQWLENQISAMPDPKTAAVGAALIKTDDQMMQIAASAAGSIGSMMGG